MGAKRLGGLGGARKANQGALQSRAILVLVVTAPAVIFILSDSRRIPLRNRPGLGDRATSIPYTINCQIAKPALVVVKDFLRNRRKHRFAFSHLKVAPAQTVIDRDIADSVLL